MAAELKIGIGADNSGLNKGLQDAEKQITAFVNKIEKIANVGEQLSSIGQKMSVGLTLPILALGGSAIKAYGDIQSLQKGLEAVMGSGAAAGKEFEKLKEVARLPGLGMEEAVKGSINLQAIGIDADRSRKILSQFGNAVASVGKGKAEFERAIYGVQQLANTDFPLGEDLNIIKDALPQVSNLLKEAFGSSRSDELAKMGVSSKQVLDTITAGLEKLPRVTGGINGAFENLGDSMKTSLARIGKIIDDTFDISGIIDKLTGYMDKAVSVFENFSPAVQKSILVVAGLAAAAGPLLVVIGGLMAALPTIIAGFGAVKVALVALTGPIGLVTAGIAGIIALVVANWSKITPYLVRTANNFIQLYNESEKFRGAVLGIALAFEGTYTVIKSFAISAYNTLKSFGKGVLNLFEGVSLMIRGAFSMDGDMISQGWAKANAKVALSFDDLGSRIEGLNTKYKNLFNAGPRKMVTAADFEITSDPDKTAEAIANEIKKGANKTKGKPVELQIPIKVTIPAMAGLAESNPLSWLFSEDQLAIFKDRINNSVVPTVEGTITDAMVAIQNRAIEFNDSVNLMLQDNFVNMFAGIGEALMTGASIMEIGRNAVLNTLGQFAIMFGKELVKTAAIAEVFGGLIIAIEKAITNPYALLAIAAAAIVVGSALSASAKRTSSVGRGGGGYSSGGLSTGAGGGVANYTSSYSTGTGSNNEFRFVIMGDDLYSVMERAKAKHERLS